MIEDTILSTVHEHQSHAYTCGAACVVMVLSRWGQTLDQGNAWTAIQTNTGTIPRPANAPWRDGSFSTQRCDKCNDDIQIGADGKAYGNYHCWFTSPEAMAATINASSSSQTVAVDYIYDGDETLRRLADSIQKYQVPAVFTKKPSLHWAVAVGFRSDDVQPPGGDFVSWGTKYLTGLYVADPSDLSVPQGTIHMVTPPGLLGFDGLLMSIECGPCERRDHYPIVAAGSGAASGGTLNFKVIAASVLTSVIWIIRRLNPWWHYRYWVQPRPGPPPKD